MIQAKGILVTAMLELPSFQNKYKFLTRSLTY